MTIFYSSTNFLVITSNSKITLPETKYVKQKLNTYDHIVPN